MIVVVMMTPFVAHYFRYQGIPKAQLGRVENFAKQVRRRSEPDEEKHLRC